jgi:hypothetical protein
VTYHLNGDVKDGLEVELATALLEEVFETLAEKVHHHHVVHLAVLRLLVAHEVQEWHEGFASEFVDELALPKEHDVTLHLDSFFLHGDKVVRLLKKRKSGGEEAS